MAGGLKTPRGGLASSVEMIASMLSWNFVQWRPFVKDVLNALLTEGKVYTSELLPISRERYGVAPRTVQRWLKKLTDLGILEKHREGKVGESGRWYYSASPAFFTMLRKLAAALERRYLG